MTDNEVTAALEEAQAIDQIRSFTYVRTDGTPHMVIDYWPDGERVPRLPATEPGDRTTGLAGRQPIPYMADGVWALMRGAPTTVWVVGTEEEAEAMTVAGHCATTIPVLPGREWADEWTQFFRKAAEVVIVVDRTSRQTNQLTCGQAYGLAARRSLRSAGVKVRVVAPAHGTTTASHFAAGLGPEDFEIEPSVFVRPRGERADVLMERKFEPIRWAIEGVIPTGLTIFAGSPKAGKSWCSLDMCLAVAMGGRSMQELQACEGSAIYLAREDTYRRLQSRMRLLLGSPQGAPPNLELVPNDVEWVGGEAGIANLSEWADEARDPRLVVLDTLAKVEPDLGEATMRGNSYNGNYSMMARYKQWADDHNCAVVVVHHDNKTPAGKDGSGNDDVFARISGTRGLTGAADTLLFLESKRGEPRGTLHVTGRDVVEQEIEMLRQGPLWGALDSAVLTH